MIKDTDKPEIGMEVIESRGKWKKIICKIDRITPSGQIVLENCRRYSKQGLGSSRDRYEKEWPTRDTITIATAEMKQEIIRKENIEYLNHFEFAKLDDSSLESIIKLINMILNTPQKP